MLSIISTFIMIPLRRQAMKNRYKLYLPIFFAVLFLSILMPPAVIYYISNVYVIDRVHAIQIDDYYDITTSAASQTISRKLTESDRIKLITGEWESIVTECDSNPLLTDSQAQAETARAAVNKLYQMKLYDHDFYPTDKDWYSWDIEYFRCTDVEKGLYSAYYYVVHFYEYNGDFIADVKISENGTIIEIKDIRGIVYTLDAKSK